MTGRTFSFEVTRSSRASAATLFEIVTDGANWKDWAKPLQSSWERLGDPLPAGLGAVRKVGLWPMLMREKTIGYEPDLRHVYTLIGPPSPVTGYRAEVVLRTTPSGGTDLRWSGSFRETVPLTGPVMLLVLKCAVRRFARQLVAFAEREE